MFNRFVIANPDRCLGCYTCMAACVVNHLKQGLQAYPRLHVSYSPVGTMPVQCHHCEDAPCTLVCPVKAIEVKDQMVKLNEGLCIGCKMCALACPFGAITVEGTPPPSVEAEPAPSLSSILAWFAGHRRIGIKCDLCDFDEQGPQCVRVCPTKALQLVDGEDLERWGKLKRAGAITGTVAFFKGAEG